jgi:hypothetical protein
VVRTEVTCAGGGWICVRSCPEKSIDASTVVLVIVINGTTALS